MKYLPLLLLVIMSTVAVANPLPERAKVYYTILKEETKKHDSPVPAWLIAGLIEMETCVTVKSRKCWSPRAQYKTRRETGVGFGMITKTKRYDTLRGVRKMDRSLRHLTWKNIKQKPRLQLRAITLITKNLYKSLPTGVKHNDKLAMVISGYNQGLGGIRKDIRICAKRAGCNPNKWFGNVAKVKRYALNKRIPGVRNTLWKVNRKHVRNTFVKSIKYTGNRIKVVKIKRPLPDLVVKPRSKPKHLILVKWTPDELDAINVLMA